MASRTTLGTQAKNKKNTTQSPSNNYAPTSSGLTSTSSANYVLDTRVNGNTHTAALGGTQGQYVSPIVDPEPRTYTGLNAYTNPEYALDYLVNSYTPPARRNTGGNNDTTDDSGGGGDGGGGGSGGGSGSPSGSGSASTPRTDIPLEQAYIPGNDPAYQEALNALNNLTGVTPTYTPSYDDQLSELYNRIIGRGPFQYDLNQDPFYQQYRTQAIDTGRLAMMDSMGQAAALTGGYGSSYGAQVGQQQYDAYLRALNEQVPEFYNSAYNRWLNEGNELESQYNLTRTMANDEYNRYQDQLSDYYRQLDLATDRENTLYNRGRTEASDAANARNENRDRILKLITATGYTPSEAELEAAGMSPSEAAAWQNYYLASITPSGGGGGGGGSGSGNVKLNFDSDEISAAISAYQTRGLDGLDNYEMQLMLQGYSPEAIDVLDGYIQGSYAANTGEKGESEEARRRRTQVTPSNTTTGLTSHSDPDEVLRYYGLK